MIKKLYKKYKEIIDYVFFGVLTTVVNLIVFKVFDVILGSELYLVTNVISWVVAVLFAFFTNKLWVFNSKTWQPGIVIPEFVSFIGARLLSLAVEEAGLWLLIDLIGLDSSLFSFKLLFVTIDGNFVSKIILQIVVIIINYIFSKFIIFRDRKKGKASALQGSDKITDGAEIK